MIPDFEDISLVVIDIQERLVGAMPELAVKRVVAYTELLAELVDAIGGKVYYTEQYPRGLGSTVEALTGALEGAQRYEKISFSAVGQERFARDLREMSESVVVVGMEAHVCVLQTVFDIIAEAALDKRDCSVFVPMDAICSRRKLNWENALDQMTEAGALITNTETLLFQALGEAGNETFKHFSKRLKEVDATLGDLG